MPDPRRALVSVFAYSRQCDKSSHCTLSAIGLGLLFQIQGSAGPAHSWRFSMEKVAIGPRRIGHVNLYVSQLERSIDFYQKTCGLELVRLEPGIRGGFHS